MPWHPESPARHLARRSTGRAPWAVLAILGLLLTMALPVHAQLGLDCPGCAFMVTVESWNGTAEPGGRLGGTFRIDNTGESADQYDVRVETGDQSWPYAVEPGETDEVPPGSGLFAESGNHTQFRMNAAVPPGTRAGARASFVVVVTSQNMPEDAEGRQKTVRVEGRALQVYDWRLDCTPEATVQKSGDTTILLNATNQGNGADTVLVRIDADDRFSTSDLPRIDLPDAGAASVEVVVGASLRLDDQAYPFLWTLVRDDGTEAASCTSSVTVVGGADTTTTTDDGPEESPGPAPVLVLMALASLVARQRRRRRGR